MKYTAARELIQSGDVIFQSHRPLRSWYDLKIAAVRAATRSDWSHAALAWNVGGRMFVIEAVSPNVRIFPMSRIGDFTWIQRGGFTTVQEALALSIVGEEYSEWEAFKSFFGNQNERNSVWQCMEVVAAVLALPLDKPTPANGYRYLTEYEGLTGRFVSNPTTPA